VNIGAVRGRPSGIAELEVCSVERTNGKCLSCKQRLKASDANDWETPQPDSTKALRISPIDTAKRPTEALAADVLRRILRAVSAPRAVE
jgi:hypothetical protein